MLSCLIDKTIENFISIGTLHFSITINLSELNENRSDKPSKKDLKELSD